MNSRRKGIRAENEAAAALSAAWLLTVALPDTPALACRIMGQTAPPRAPSGPSGGKRERTRCDDIREI